MELFRKIFCKHKYKLVARLRSGKGSVFDFDYGWYEDRVYECLWCGKRKKETVRSDEHPLKRS